jgi:hypothetical protein
MHIYRFDSNYMEFHYVVAETETEAIWLYSQDRLEGRKFKTMVKITTDHDKVSLRSVPLNKE